MTSVGFELYSVVQGLFSNTCLVHVNMTMLQHSLLNFTGYQLNSVLILRFFGLLKLLKGVL